MAIHLTARDTAIAALKAYDEKRLSAQGPTPACMYRDKSGLPCAIGAAINDEQHAEYTPSGTIGFMIASGVITVSPEDRYPLQRLQDLHDAWATNINLSVAAGYEAEFVAYARELAA